MLRMAMATAYSRERVPFKRIVPICTSPGRHCGALMRSTHTLQSATAAPAKALCGEKNRLRQGGVLVSTLAVEKTSECLSSAVAVGVTGPLHQISLYIGFLVVGPAPALALMPFLFAAGDTMTFVALAVLALILLVGGATLPYFLVSWLWPAEDEGIVTKDELHFREHGSIQFATIVAYKTEYYLKLILADGRRIFIESPGLSGTPEDDAYRAFCRNAVEAIEAWHGAHAPNNARPLRVAFYGSQTARSLGVLMVLASGLALIIGLVSGRTGTAVMIIAGGIPMGLLLAAGRRFSHVHDVSKSAQDDT
jgi:hypothetical protein